MPDKKIVLYTADVVDEDYLLFQGVTLCPRCKHPIQWELVESGIVVAEGVCGCAPITRGSFDVKRWVAYVETVRVEYREGK